MKKIIGFLSIIVAIAVMYFGYIYLIPVINEWDPGSLSLGEYGGIDTKIAVITGSAVLVAIVSLILTMSGKRTTENWINR